MQPFCQDRNGANSCLVLDEFGCSAKHPIKSHTGLVALIQVVLIPRAAILPLTPKKPLEVKQHAAVAKLL